MSPLEFQVPNLNPGALAPLLIVLTGAALGVLVEAFAPRRDRHFGQIAIQGLTLAAALALIIHNALIGRLEIAAGRSVAADGPAMFTWAMLLVFTALALCLFAERTLYHGQSVFTPAAVAVPGSEQEREAIEHRLEHTEVYPLAMFALAGMMLFAAANDLLTLFVGLEVMSLPLYLLCGLARRRRLLSQEAALKYFLLGSLSSAIFLFGIALVYGFTGSFFYDAIGTSIGKPNQGPLLLVAGMGMMIVGLLFKIGAVPFHNWTPDVYVGAPTPVTGFMASCTKIAAVAALVRLLFVALGGARWDWQLLIAIVSALTILVGSVLAIVQTDVKRMLAYSSVAHAGFILTAVAGASTYQNGVKPGQLTSVSAIGFYLAAYGFATLGAFAILTMVRRESGEATSLDAWRGVGRKHPLLGLAFALFMLSFAGIPLTAGFIGKWAVFLQAFQGGFAWLVILAVIMSLVAAFFYLRVIVVMFFSDEDEADDVVVGRASVFTWIPIVVGLVATVVFGLIPGPLLDLALRAGELLR